MEPDLDLRILGEVDGLKVVSIQTEADGMYFPVVWVVDDGSTDLGRAFPSAGVRRLVGEDIKPILAVCRSCVECGRTVLEVDDNGLCGQSCRYFWRKRKEAEKRTKIGLKARETYRKVLEKAQARAREIEAEIMELRCTEIVPSPEPVYGVGLDQEEMERVGMSFRRYMEPEE